MEKIYYIIMLAILFNSYICAKNVEEINLDIDWVSHHNIKWSPNSAKIGIISKNGLFIINREGELIYISKIDYDSVQNLEWINNDKIAITYANILEIKNIQSGNCKKYDLPFYAFSISYNKYRNELAIASDDKVMRMPIDSRKLINLVEIGGTTIGDVFYNNNGTRLFFTVQSGNYPHLYTFYFEDWVLDRVSKEFLSPCYINEIENVGYFDEGMGPDFGYNRKRVEMNLNTLEIKKYEKREGNIIIDGYRINSDLRFKLYSSEGKEDIYVILSPDENSALIVSDESVKLIKKLTLYK